MATSYAATLLAECLIAQGLSQDQAEKAAEFVVQALPAAGLVRYEVLEAWERDARVYKLRGMKLTALAIGSRLGICRRAVFDAIKRHQHRRRAILRLSA